jgi:hypothetical protein
MYLRNMNITNEYDIAYTGVLELAGRDTIPTADCADRRQRSGHAETKDVGVLYVDNRREGNDPFRACQRLPWGA